MARGCGTRRTGGVNVLIGGVPNRPITSGVMSFANAMPEIMREAVRKALEAAARVRPSC